MTDAEATTRTPTDDATLIDLLKKGHTNNQIGAVFVCSGQRLKRLRGEIAAAEAKAKKKRAPKTIREAAVAITEALTPATDVVDDDGFVSVSTEYLRALELCAELAREGVEARAELARLKG